MRFLRVLIGLAAILDIHLFAEGGSPQTDHPKTIIWAGLQGTPPRYFDSGEKKGLGFEEIESKELRAALVDAGFEVKREYMTSTRLQYAFRNKQPICFYPVKWMPAKEPFGSNPERILSLPLNFGGEEVHYIIFRAGEAKRFEKHFDEKGNLSLASLVRDKTLRAVFPSNRDLPNDLKVAISEKSGIMSTVNPDFADHITLIVPSENRQMLAMLDGHRYDYTLSEFIESDDFEKVKPGHAGFETLEYGVKRLKGLDDPAVVYHSVACAVQPTTIAAMPIMNWEIKQVRGDSWYLRNLRYQTLFDANVHVPIYDEVIQYRFALDLQKGTPDEWYSRQIAKVPGLKKFLPPKIENVSPSLIDPQLPKQDTRLWIAARPHPDVLWIINTPDLGYYQSMRRIHLGYQQYTAMRADPLRKPFFPLADFAKVDDPHTPKQKVVEFNEIDLGPEALMGTTQLVVYASGIETAGLPKLHLALRSPSLKKLALIDAGLETAEVVVKDLSPQLEELNLAFSTFNGVPLGKKVAAMKQLRALNLHNTTMDREDFVEILRNLPPTLEELYLGWQNTRWDVALAQEFSRLKLPNLRILDLENAVMDDSHLTPVLKAVGPALEALNLCLNYATSDGLLEFFSRPHPRLRHLNLAKTALSSLPSKKLKIPDSVEELDLSLTDLNAARLANVHLPTKLRYFSARENQLTDADLETLLPRFAPQMDGLILNNNRVDGNFLKQFARYGISKIDVLDLSNNGVKADSLRALAKSTKVSDLALQSVQLENAPTKSLLSAWGSELRNLDLCETLVTGEILAVIKATAPRLTQLRLCSILDLQESDLAALPSSLASLDLSDNRLSDAMLEQLAKHLPKSLRSLTIHDSRFGRQGILALIKVMPTLYSLSIGSSDLGELGYRDLAMGLPNTLLSLTFEGKFSEDTARAMAQNMPKFLQRLSLTGIGLSARMSALLMGALPSTIRQLNLGGESDLALPKDGGKAAARLRNLRIFFSYSDGDLSEGLTDLLQAPLKALVGIHIKTKKLSEGAQLAIAKRAPQLGSLELMRLPIAGSAFKELKTAGMKNLRQISINDFDWMDFAVLDKNDLQGLKRINIIGARMDGKNLAELLTRLPPTIYMCFFVSIKLSLEDVDAVIAALPPGVRILRIGGNEIGRIGIGKFRDYKEKVDRETGYQIVLEGVGG